VLTRMNAKGVSLMKKQAIQRAGLIIALYTALMLPYTFAAETDSLSAAENKLFSRDYTSDSIEQRLSRMETVIYGQVQQGDLERRQAQLESVLLENQPKAADKASLTQGSALGQDGANDTAESAEPKEKDATDYPTITLIEQKVFSQNYAQEPIAKRLARLEKQVFQQTYDELPMVDRVDQLTLKVIPDSPLGVEENVAPFGLPKTSKELSGSSLAVYSQVTALEEQILGKSFGGELMANRLSRLEQKVFGTPKAGTIDSRVSNLIKQYPQQSAQQSYVGRPQAYTPNSAQVPPGLLHPTSPNQVMVGTMMSGNQRFSKDMMEMMPPGIRQQFEAYGNGSVAGATPGNSSTQTESYGGFNSGSSTWTTQSDIVVPIAPNSLYMEPGRSAESIHIPSNSKV
jgi:hypothetical protein